MTISLTNLRSILTFSLAILFLSNLFLQSEAIRAVVLILMVLVISLSLTVVSGSSKVIGYISFTLSILLLITFQAPLAIWEQALEENLYLVVMFTMVPLLRIPIQHGGYFEALQGFFRRFVHTKSRFYLLVSFISAFIGVLVNLAVVPLVHEISKASDLNDNKRLLSSAISRGFCTCTIWSPTMASIAVIIQLTGAKWLLFFPFAFFSGVVIGLVGYLLTMYEEKRNGQPYPAVPEHKTNNINYGKVIELSFFGMILIVGIAFISLLTGMHTILVVSLAALLFPIIWLAVIKRLPVLFREFKGEYFHTSLPNLKNEIILFVGAGLFATSITYSHLGDYVPLLLSKLVGTNAFYFTVVVIFTSLLLGAMGVHPIVTITVVGGTVEASAFGVSSTYLAMVLAISWAMSICISPSAANIIAVAGLAGQSPIQVGPRWNGRYAILGSVVLILLITMLRWLHLL